MIEVLKTTQKNSGHFKVAGAFTILVIGATGHTYVMGSYDGLDLDEDDSWQALHQSPLSASDGVMQINAAHNMICKVCAPQPGATAAIQWTDPNLAYKHSIIKEWL